MSGPFAKGNTSQVGYVDAEKYHKVVQKLRNFFINKGFTETHLQSRLSILAACEDPQSLATFKYNGNIYPLPQTNQMYLEYQLLTNPNSIGYFCVATSYREEKNPIEGRHDLIFPLFEIETRGTMDDMAALWKELLLYLGYKNPVEVNYEDICKKYGTEFLDHTHEERLYQEYGPAVLLKYFPMRTSPFFNMKLCQDENGTPLAKKIDVILSGMETIGSAERSCDVEEMRRQFYTISDGEYANTLFNLFGRERVEAELNDFLKLDFFTRFGCGMGMTRLIKSMVKEGLV